jgi:hypothetical protein
LTKPGKLALALFLLLAIVVFNVTFDWQTRMAGHAFVGDQLARQRHGQPLQTINDGFRPMVRQAAVDASLWLVLIAGAGTALTLAADRSRGRRAAPAPPEPSAGSLNA